MFIQWGASQFYPASAMACHVTASPNHQTKRETPLKYRFDVAMTGRLGFELHPKDMTAKEIFAAASGRLPKDFTDKKVQYILLNEMKDEIIKTEAKGKPNTYRLK